MNATTGAAVPDGHYRIAVGERTFDVDVQAGVVTMDGEPVDFSFEPIGAETYSLIAGGRSLTMTLTPMPGGEVRIVVEGRELRARVSDERALLLEQFGVAAGAGSAHREVHAPMPGLVLSVLVEHGQAVKAGEGLLVLEAMKMENELRAPVDGVVHLIYVSPGDAVGKNQLLIEFEE